MFNQEEYKEAYQKEDFKTLKRKVQEEKGMSSVYDALLLLIEQKVKQIPSTDYK